MKKATLFFALLLTSFTSMANVSGELAPTVRSEINFNSEVIIYKGHLPSLYNLGVKFGIDNSCTVSITVTVRVGINSSYAEASVTVSGIPCDAIASEIRRLKGVLKNALE